MVRSESFSFARLQLAEDGQTKKLSGVARALLAPSVREVEAILPSNVLRDQPVDELRRGVR